MAIDKNSRNGKLILLILGWIFIVLGVLGLFLPILQGILFLLIGLVLLAQVSPRVRLLRIKLRQRYPKAAGKFDEAESLAADWFDRVANFFRSDVNKRRKK